MELASGVEGIDHEIALLRVKIKSLLEKDPENIMLILQATSTLAGLVRTRYNITPKQDKDIRVGIRNVLREVGMTIGMNVGKNIIENLLH